MVHIQPASTESLPAFLAARARAATDGRLVSDVAVGALSALGIAVWRPALWLIPFGAAMFLAAFGVWGIAEREIAERAHAGSSTARALRAIQLAAVAVGALAAALACFAALSRVLGTWIS